MPQRQIAQVEESLATFKSLLATHTSARDRLAERKAKAVGKDQIAKLDNLLAINQHTIDAVKRAAELLEGQLRQLQAAESHAAA